MPSVCSKPAPSSFGQVTAVGAQFPPVRIIFSSCEALQECAVDLCHFALGVEACEDEECDVLPVEAFQENACALRDWIGESSGTMRMDLAAACITSWLASHIGAPVGTDVSVSTSPPTIATAGLAHAGGREAQGHDDQESAQTQRPGLNADSSFLAAFFPSYFPDSVLLKISCAQAGIFAATIIANSLALGAWTFMPSACCLYHFGASWGPAIAAGSIIRLVTPIFLHASFPHLLLNTVFQCRMGFSVEKELGSSGFACLYLLSGVVGNVFSAAVEPWKLAVGASTSALGLYGANAALQVLNWHALTPQARLKNLFVFAVIGSAFVFSSTTGTDACGHVGGFLAGVCLSTLMVDREYVARSPFANNWSQVRVGAMAVLGGIVGWSAGTLLVFPVDPAWETNMQTMCPYSWDWALDALGQGAATIA